jgi:hypothetical protein
VARLTVKVVTRSSRSELVADGEGYRAYLHAAPTGGQANQELIQLVSDAFGVPKSTIRIVRGAKSRIKEVEY